ncbi:unnamed protein product [Cyberlindnera jadinii]|uniref:Mediator of RNA polymerase II transcription subunit 18 n=1 Tax=Cyberlindnera jadinii (strain ATCC 18201 / CBS 1600 / BCRC 20928 / JCM 3617 / NBRC 0987 / NRRL Y-1542) TaxID=983966 RepID=A0A0H5C995_CYBJN|nr:unnamed protein product [Cyberlindnera jadinii]
MVQQLSLFAKVEANQHPLLTKVLSTLTGLPPHKLEYLSLLMVPKNIVKYEPNSKNAQFEQHRLKLNTSFDPSKQKSDYKEWILQATDIPSAGKRKTLTQNLVESCIVLKESQNIESMFDKLGYTVEKEFVVRGQRWCYGNVVIKVFQVLVGEERTPLDSSYVVKCFVNVDKTTDVELLQRSTQELLSLKNELTGLIELEIPDRNSMDSRIGIRK